MTDPIDAMLNTIKTASLRGKPSVSVPYSKMKHAIALCLSKEGYVGTVSKNEDGTFPVLEIALAYGADKKPKVHDIRRISKTSRRMYIGAKTIRSKHGITVLSTPKGIMTGRDAKKELVGGEILFTLW